MPNALAFIGGGLLQGAGKALLEEEREKGKAKRERALADLEHKRGLERDEKKLEGKAKFERVLAEIEQKNAWELKLAPGASKLPSGYRPTEGGLEFTPGGPADPSQARLLAEAKRDPDGGVTQAQQANNAEIDQARTTLDRMGLDKAEILRRTQKATNTGRENPDYDPGLERIVRAATQRKVGSDPYYNLFHRRYLGPPPEFSEPAGPKALPPGVSAEEPDVFDRVSDFFTGGDDQSDPVSDDGPRRGRGRPGVGGRVRGRGGSTGKPIPQMSVTEIDDLINTRGDSLSPADLRAIEARLEELGM